MVNTLALRTPLKRFEQFDGLQKPLEAQEIARLGVELEWKAT